MDSDISNIMRRNLLAYLVVSAFTFSCLILVVNAGISVLVFVAVQFVCLWYLSPSKKPLLVFVPLFIFGLNAFISANTMWRVPNVIVALLLYSVMALWLTGQFSLKGSLMGFAVKTLVNVFEPFGYYSKPVSWCLEGHKAHMPLVRRVLLGVGIAVPCLIFLSVMLASADAIFAYTVGDWVWNVVELLRIDTILRAIIGALVGFYLFGVMYYVNMKDRKMLNSPLIKARHGDLIVINIVMVSVLLIYTLFVVIQFRYLFASVYDLPFGLTFEAYARRGFFELMFLTALNIACILVTVWLTKESVGNGARLTRALNLYLCAVTSVLLVSSFYRMWLHGSDDGLTRMRFMVFGFLIFKAIGIAATFVYIAKPRFNIVAVYCAIALVYYLLLNVVPMDAIVARSQIDRYFTTGRAGVWYVTLLSPDAAAEVSRLYASESTYTRERVRQFFDRTDMERGSWRQWNISADRYVRIRNGIGGDKTWNLQ